MDEAIVVSRKLEALNVLRLIGEGMSVNKACKELQIDPRTFHKYIGNEPEVTQLFQELLSETSKQEIALLLGYRVSIVGKIMQQAMGPKVKIKDRIAALNTAEKYLGQLMEQERIGGTDNGAAEEVLGGPILTKAASRFSITQTVTKTTTTLTAESVPRSEQADVIEGEFHPPDTSELSVDTNEQTDNLLEAGSDDLPPENSGEPADQN
jgi:hypothetical protein